MQKPQCTQLRRTRSASWMCGCLRASPVKCGVLSELRLVSARPRKPGGVVCEGTLTAKQFEETGERCKDYIRAGDVFQVVISQRRSAMTRATPFDVYRALRVINPSPFMFYVQTPATTLVGASPEILCRLEDRTVYTRPLAGTRARGRTESEGLGLEKERMAEPKERAEQVMRVDWGRKNLGRVC